MAPVAFVLALITACGSNSGSGTETASGFMFIDPTESHLCESMLESYPPQCGDPSVQLLDLDPETVVALMSPADQQVAPFFWTEYVLGVEGISGTSGLSDVVLTDPVYSSEGESMTLRTADLGVVVGEPAIWPFDLTNNKDEDVTLTFTSGQRMDLVLSNDSGEVYRWSGDMFFTQIVEEVLLTAGGTFPYVLAAEPIDLPPGVYTATAWFTAVETADVILEWQVTISS
jgi:hypothetical protein